ncbi:unnamed protein product [Agarophyton chilense]
MSAAPRFSAPSTESLPATFFDDARCADTGADRRTHEQRCLLARCLLLASQHRWVAEWLFSDPHTRFHRNLHVALSAFDHAHPLSIMHSFQGQNSTRNLASEMLLIPMANMNAITVGYITLRGGSNWHGHVGRYAFHSQSAEVLMVVNNYTPDATAVMAVIPQPDTVKQFLITCPVLEYSFNNLPNQAFTVHVAERDQTSKNSPQQIAHQLQAFPASIDRLLELCSTNDSMLPSSSYHSDLLSLLDLDPPSQLPWIIDSASSLSDNIGIPANPGTADTSSGAFNLTAISDSIRHIENTLHGTFLGTSEIHYPLALAFESPVKQTIVSIAAADSLEATLLRRYAVKVYFDATTPVISDEKYLALPSFPYSVTAEPSPSQPQNSTGNDKQYFRRIAPSPMTVASDNPTVAKADADLARERTLEARRRRNRLSAARSNDKRKEKWKRKVQTLQELRERMKNLLSKQQQLVEENGMLRKLVGYDVAGGRGCSQAQNAM